MRVFGWYSSIQSFVDCLLDFLFSDNFDLCYYLLMCVAQNYVTSDQSSSQQKTKAPLVDSDLLRFLSSQKKSGTVLLKDDENKIPYTTE